MKIKPLTMLNKDAGKALQLIAEGSRSQPAYAYQTLLAKFGWPRDSAKRLLGLVAK